MNLYIRVLTFTLALACLFALYGCGAKREAEPFVDVVKPLEPLEGEAADGARFSGSVLLEGTEEPVKLEHIISARAGISMDYDYENFIRTTSDETEYFQWKYDDMTKVPSCYMSITASSAQDYAMSEHLCEYIRENESGLEQTDSSVGRYSGCDTLIARSSLERSDGGESVTVRYVIPAPDGCRVAKLCYPAEAAEGVGIRMEQMLASLEVREIDWSNR